MKTKIAALALLLMAGTAPAAFAQDQDHQDRGGGEQRPAGQPHEHRGGGDHTYRPQVQPAPTAPQAPQAQAAPQAHEPRQQAQGARPGFDDGRRFVRRPGSWVDTNGDDTSQGLDPADRVDQEDRQELRDWRRYGRDPRLNPQAPGPDRRTEDHRQGGDHHWDADHRDGDHRDRDNHGRPEWRPGAYPHSFLSHRRYHFRPYLRPPHFFIHTWGFGEFLPPAWYGPEYVIEDWRDFDLPAPPYGYIWVRVGDDVLLVDDYDGRVVQVVRALFW